MRFSRDLVYLLLGLAIIAAGFAVYFVPIGVADARPFGVQLSEPHLAVPLEGNGTLRTRLQFNETFPDAAQDPRFVLALGVHFTVEKAAGEPRFFRLHGNATVESAQGGLIERHWDQMNETTGVIATLTPPLDVRCPCPRARIVFQFDLFGLHNDTTGYAYRFVYHNATLVLRPADRDHDGVPDTTQWIPSVPQYYLGFPLTVVGGILIARRMVGGS